MPAPDDARWMRAALALGRRGLGSVWPNPAVGCVIVRDGRVLGRGSTGPGGRPHAETVALGMAAARWGGAQGAAAYVSLEPCAHQGRTPPCADALVAAGVARVVAPIEDPDPRVSGRGFAALRAGGVRVDTGLLADEAMEVNRGFLMRLGLGRPFVTLKLAATLDGRIATASGESRWITGPEARARVHLMRALHDAVLVGAGTARADDPMLDVRGLGLSDLSPVRVLLDGGLSIRLDGRLARSASRTPLWVLHRENAPKPRRAALEDLGAVPLAIPTAAGGEIDLRRALTLLGDRGITRLFCEGGGGVAASLLKADLVDEIAWFTAGAAIGRDGVPAVAAFGVTALDAAPRFALRSVEAVGGDVLSLWRRA